MNEEQLFQQYSTNRALQATYPDFESYKQGVMSINRNQNVFQTLAQRGQEFLGNIPQYLGEAKERITGGLGNLYEGIKDKLGFFPSPVGLAMGLIDKFDRFDDLPLADQQYITQSMEKGKQGLGGFYRDPSSGIYKDPRGINVRSLFGNYADYIAKQNQIRNINPVREYTSPNQLAYNAFVQNQFNKLQQARQVEANQYKKAAAEAVAKKHTSGGQGEGKVSGSKYGGAGFSSQGGPYGSGPGGLHDY